MTSRHVAAAIVLPLLVAALTACTSSSPEPITTTAPTTAPEIAEPTAVPKPTFDCITVAQSTIDAINTGVTAVEPGNSITEAYAIKAGERENAYFVAAAITGDGLNTGDAQALWVTNDDVTVDPHSGLVFSVNGGALAFSDWGDGTKTDAAFSSTEDGAQDALDCIPQ